MCAEHVKKKEKKKKTLKENLPCGESNRRPKRGQELVGAMKIRREERGEDYDREKSIAPRRR